MNSRITGGLLSLQYILTIIQTNEVFQLIELILSVILTLILIIFKLRDWLKKSKEDGIISVEEVEEAASIINDGLKEIEEAVEKYEEKKDGEKME